MPETNVWCAPREKEFIVDYMGRQGWIFGTAIRDDAADGIERLKITFYTPPPPPPPRDEWIVLETACGCRRVLKMPFGTPVVEMPLYAKSKKMFEDGPEALRVSTIDDRRQFERHPTRKDDEGRPIYQEVR